MGADYDVEWDPKALKELRKLDGTIRLQFLKKLQERQAGPRVPSDALHDMKDCYKIKLRGAGYRLVYRVEDERIVILVLAVGKRERSSVYEQAGKR
ncbi:MULTISPECIES: type II toxin-antitoxin system RelE family toxin [Pseudomonas]|uniref:Type II toxin-antitoxin system mRNA interferase toxin, RelE/StbE family n=1 Tax=Pseudomonas lactis TaxID=1615674 RepID=A0ABS9FQT4_9PSED|nr:MULTISPECIES: type II toxin-antitoxin system RelE/ParE family toxin [Pseudomonas]MBI6976073.1 type II toxin-antitoxin system RelE/ParE family toxin [Pseudomonas lactis]MCF4976241.1 type II toxin-antitoxin system mRNA interferase toxin, RelE/StbE family [Pseudomonas lactis]MCF5002090.1 type II toxin-antitoxin system mRNA interferase toxin, RelE/StbE family [Pseudomonas lactis]MCF5008863.1 type II toxin-antitoxin system mRNA interferase toxin, RelE/StbE family [Pseudomonas lactis]MCF5015502.1